MVNRQTAHYSKTVYFTGSEIGVDAATQTQQIEIRNQACNNIPCDDKSEDDSNQRDIK